MVTRFRRQFANLVAALLAVSLPVPNLVARADGLPGYIPPAQVLRSIQVAGANGIPANATAVFANVTLTDSGGAGYLSLSDNFQVPTTSTVDVASRGQTASNLALFRLSAAGQST